MLPSQDPVKHTLAISGCQFCARTLLMCPVNTTVFAEQTNAPPGRSAKLQTRAVQSSDTESKRPLEFKEKCQLCMGKQSLDLGNAITYLDQRGEQNAVHL